MATSQPILGSTAYSGEDAMDQKVTTDRGMMMAVITGIMYSALFNTPQKL